MSRNLGDFLIALLSAQNVLYWDVRLHDDIQRDTIHLWSFVHLTDVHIGEGEGDYGTTGYLDTLTGSEEGYAVNRLRAALTYLAQNWNAYKLAFIVVTGDLTDSGERSEYLRFKALMDSSGLPYIAFIGNHDVWPYVNAANEAPWAYGDSLAVIWLSDMYSRFRGMVDAWYEDLALSQSVWNPERNHPSRFHNFYFDFRGVRFIAVDGISRKPAPFGQAGVGPDADLHDFPGGTMRFLDMLLSQMQHYPLIFLCHYPLIDNPLSGANSFSPQEYERIVNLLYGQRQKVRVWLAGHIHRTQDYPLRHPASGIQFARCVETPANKDQEGGQFRIVRIWGDASSASLPGREPAHPFEVEVQGNTLRVEGYGRLQVYTPLGQKVGEAFLTGSQEFRLESGVYYLQFLGEGGVGYVRRVLLMGGE